MRPSRRFCPSLTDSRFKKYHSLAISYLNNIRFHNVITYTEFYYLQI